MQKLGSSALSGSSALNELIGGTQMRSGIGRWQRSELPSSGSGTFVYGSGTQELPSKDMAAAKHISHSLSYIVFFFWVFLGFLYLSLFTQWLAINWRDKVFVEYIDYVIQVAATNSVPLKKFAP
jgi:hypothetical protein